MTAAGSIIRAIDGAGEAQVLKDQEQSISSSSWTRIEYQMIAWDDWAYWDDQENEFVVPPSMGGLYRATLTVTWASNNSGVRMIDITSSAGNVTGLRSDSQTTGPFPQNISDEIRLEPGDTVWAQAYQTSGSDLDVEDNSQGTMNKFTLTRIRP